MVDTRRADARRGRREEGRREERRMSVAGHRLFRTRTQRRRTVGKYLKKALEGPQEQ